MNNPLTLPQCFGNNYTSKNVNNVSCIDRAEVLPTNSLARSREEKDSWEGGAVIVSGQKQTREKKPKADKTKTLGIMK